MPSSKVASGRWRAKVHREAGAKVTLQHGSNATTTYFSHGAASRFWEKATNKEADGSALVRFAYGPDAAGNRIAIQRESGLGVFYYEHDQLQRLAYEGRFANRPYPSLVD